MESDDSLSPPRTLPHSTPSLTLPPCHPQYGSEVQLRHVASRLYLSISNQKSRTPGALQMRLSESGHGAGGGSHFTILPGYKTSTLGEPVLFGHGITLHNSKLLSWFAVNPNISMQDSSNPSDTHLTPNDTALTPI